MTGIRTTRAEDERDLSILAALKHGRMQPDVAAEFGVSRSRVATLKQRVLADDQYYSGENPETVRKAYGV